MAVTRQTHELALNAFRTELEDENAHLEDALMVAVNVAVSAEVERLRAALRPFAALYERYEQVHDLEPREVVVPYVALFDAADALGS